MTWNVLTTFKGGAVFAVWCAMVHLAVGQTSTTGIEHQSGGVESAEPEDRQRYLPDSNPAAHHD